jgi:LuxR family maltose regulon positive regulatory protein
MRADLAVTVTGTHPATGSDPLLESKFEIPERPRFMVPRPRLFERLSWRSQTPVTLVVGPAGSGKTQLVASWTASESTDAATVWVTLEDDDGPDWAFWAYVVGALRRAGALTSRSPMPSPGATVDRSFLIRLAAELSEAHGRVVLILDGVSSLTGGQWAADLEFVVRHSSPLLRLVLVGRWDPPLPLHRYRLAGQLNEVRSADLAFTVDEAAQLLRLHGVELGAAGLSALLEHTEGWAAGLRLFAMALQNRRDTDRLIDTINGNEATIAEYFLDEVLRVQPPHVRWFLLETSILDTFTPELAEAVTGRNDARRLLMDLERRNAFVQPVAEYSAAYRFHRLFAELLQAQLSYEAPDRGPELHRRAAAWFAAQGLTVEAVSHAVRAGDWNAAATITVETCAVGQLVLEGRDGRLGTLLQPMPADLDCAAAVTVAAAFALADGDLHRCAHHLERAEELVMHRGWQHSTALALTDLILGMLLASASGDFDQALQTAAAARNLMAESAPEQLARHPELPMLMLAAKGNAESRTGAVDDAAVTLTEAIAAAAAGTDYPRVACLEHLAVIEAYRGRLQHAETLAGQAIDLADQCAAVPQPRAVAHVALAWVAMERYDLDGAGHHLRLADPRRHADGDGLAAAAFALVKSRRLQARGELGGAMKLLEEVSAGPDGVSPPEWLVREAVLSRVRLMIVVGRPGEALLELSRLREPQAPDIVVVQAAALAASGELDRARDMATSAAGSPGVSSSVSVEAWLVVATAAARNGETVNARNALRHAFRHAAPEGQRRLVQQVWAELRRVLRDDDGLGKQHRALQSGSHAGGQPLGPSAEADTIVIVEPLTKRETEVLQGMAAMLATEEIAAQLFVSINTVKTHVRSILRKLAASRRNEAIRRARALGLI